MLICDCNYSYQKLPGILGLQNQRVPCWMTALITGHLHFVEYFELLLEDGLTGHGHKLVYGLVWYKAYMSHFSCPKLYQDNQQYFCSPICQFLDHDLQKSFVFSF